jgi:hypothetical protein
MMAADHMLLDIDDNVVKMLQFSAKDDALILKISGKHPAHYVVTPVERLDAALRSPEHPSHIDALLDARNYIYKENPDGTDNA